LRVPRAVTSPVATRYDDSRIRPWNRENTRARQAGAYYDRCTLPRWPLCSQARGDPARSAFALQDVEGRCWLRHHERLRDVVQ
jgi:hypothetical protein